MIPSQVAKKKLTYNQLRQTIQRIILQEHKENSEVFTSEHVDLFIRKCLARSTK